MATLPDRRGRAARLRAAVRRASAGLARIARVPRVQGLDVAAFRALARGGCPFVITDLVAQWPLFRTDRATLRERYGEAPVVARKGDYVTHAFSGQRENVGLSLRRFIDLPPHVPRTANDLPPYVGNQKVEVLNELCQWPPYFERYGVARTWFGPAGTVTPLHCDYLENLFAQIHGRKRFLLVPPHQANLIAAREVDPVLYASTFNPEDPGADNGSHTQEVWICECVVEAGELLYLPAGWFHHVRALTDSLSVNRWADDWPLAAGDPASDGEPAV